MAGSSLSVPLVGVGTYPIERYAPWAVNYPVPDGSAGVEVKAAPGATKYLCLTHLTLSNTSLSSYVAVTIQDEDNTVYLGPISLEEDGEGNFVREWADPIKLPENKALYVVGTGWKIHGFTIYVEGFTADVRIE